MDIFNEMSYEIENYHPSQNFPRNLRRKFVKHSSKYLKLNHDWVMKNNKIFYKLKILLFILFYYLL